MSGYKAIDTPHTPIPPNLGSSHTKVGEQFNPLQPGLQDGYYAPFDHPYITYKMASEGRMCSIGWGHLPA